MLKISFIECQNLNKEETLTSKVLIISQRHFFKLIPKSISKPSKV